MTLTMTRKLATAITSTGLLLGLAATTAQAGTMPTDAHDYIYQRNGQTTPEARSVGSITVGWDSDGGDSAGDVVRGSGVLVGGRYVLTAAHLVDDAAGGVFQINGQTYNMERWVVADQFYGRDSDGPPNPDTRLFGNGADLALVLLDRNVKGARNIKAEISKSRKEVGKTATIVGYGTPGNGTSGTFTPAVSDDGNMSFGDTTPGEGVWGYYPEKRAGKNIIEPTGPFSGNFNKTNRELTIDFDPDPSQISTLGDLNPPQYNPFTGEWDIDEDDIPIAGEYMPSVGDSGGGLFINGKLAGITSWTTRENSTFFAQAQFSRLSVGWWKWVRDNIKAFNHAERNGYTARPWNTVANGGNGFRGVAKIRSETQLETDSGQVIYWEGQVINIFGPGLFRDETGEVDSITVGTNFDRFVSNDLFANSGPLPEPTSLTLLGLGGLAMLRRARA